MSEPPRGSYRDSIYKDYALIFPDIDERLASYEVTSVKAPTRRKMLKDTNPDMFPAGYPRFCTHEPTVLETQEEMDAAVAASGHPLEFNPYVMVFPQYGEGVRRAYVCKHEDREFVGLKLNSLSNRLTHAYLPCCYSANQIDNENRPRYKYEHQAEEDAESGEAKKTSRPKMFISNKAMKQNDHGTLPPLVDKFLRTIDRQAFPMYGDHTTYARQGTLRTRNSVLDAIIKAMINYYTDIRIPKEDTDKSLADAMSNQAEYKKLINARLPVLSAIFDSYDGMDNSEKAVFLSRIRKDMAVLVASNITAQSTFNLELKMVRDQLVDDTSYLDVKMFWRILEEVFHINIVLFQRNADHPQGVMGSPIFLQEYFQYQRKREDSQWRFTVFLFETMGGEFDRLEYPQVELIKTFRYSEQEEIPIVITFSWFDDAKNKITLKRMRDCFNQIFSYDGHPNLPIPNIFVSKPVAQCADFYGKIRLLQFADGICIMTEPLPPMDKSDLNHRSETKCSLVPVPLGKAQSFLSIEGVTDVRKVVIGEYVIGLQCNKATDDPDARALVSFYIPIKATKDNLSLETAPASAPSFLTQESLLDEFNRLARFARYIIEYVLWIFSKWHRDKQGDPSDQAYIAKFAAEKFQIIDSHVYPLTIPRRLDGSLIGVMTGGKIIVQSNDVKKRLIFALQIRLTQNAKEVLGYYRRDYIQKYYQDVTDFDLQESNIILFGQEMVLSWINSKLPHYVLHDRIVHPQCHEETIAEIEEDEAEVKEKQKLCDLIAEKGLIVDPYFIQLENMDQEIYLVQQASSLSNALYICKVWYEEGWNVGPSHPGKLPTDIPFRYVAYSDAYDYDIENVGGGNDTYTVLQYRSDNEIFTMALLKYSNFE